MLYVCTVETYLPWTYYVCFSEYKNLDTTLTIILNCRVLLESFVEF